MSHPFLDSTLSLSAAIKKLQDFSVPELRAFLLDPNARWALFEYAQRILDEKLADEKRKGDAEFIEAVRAASGRSDKLSTDARAAAQQLLDTIGELKATARTVMDHRICDYMRTSAGQLRNAVGKLEVRVSSVRQAAINKLLKDYWQKVPEANDEAEWRTTFRESMANGSIAFSECIAQWLQGFVALVAGWMAEGEIQAESTVTRGDDAPNKEVLVPAARPLAIKPGTTWKEIVVTIMKNESICIAHRSGSPTHTYAPESLGFGRPQKAKSMAWMALTACLDLGFIPHDGAPKSKNAARNRKKAITRALVQVTMISGPAFEVFEGTKTIGGIPKEARGYRPLFKLRPEGKRYRHGNGKSGNLPPL